MRKSGKVDRIFRAVADPTRREIFHVIIMASTAMSLTQISSQFDISRQGVTKHVRLLEDAGLITITQHGRERFCEADPTPLQEIKDWLSVYDRFWDDKIQQLDKYLDGKK